MSEGRKNQLDFPGIPLGVEAMTEFFAHSTNEDGHRHGLVEHLRAVAELAREFGEHFGGGGTAYYAGLWHDLGKFNPEFQRSLVGDRPRGPDHKASGTRLACQHLGPGGLMIQGHHGGLRAIGDLTDWLNERNSDAAVDQALRNYLKSPFSPGGRS